MTIKDVRDSVILAGFFLLIISFFVGVDFGFSCLFLIGAFAIDFTLWVIHKVITMVKKLLP